MKILTVGVQVAYIEDGQKIGTALDFVGHVVLILVLLLLILQGSCSTRHYSRKI